MPSWPMFCGPNEAFQEVVNKKGKPQEAGEKREKKREREIDRRNVP